MQITGGKTDCILVTGFGSFGEVIENPSAALAASSGCSYEVLEVSFEAVDQFLERLDRGSFDKLLLLGVAQG